MLKPSPHRREELLGRLARLQPRAGGTTAIRIAGIPVLIETPDAALANRVQEYFEEYLDREPGLPLHRVCIETDATAWLWEDEDPEFDVRGDLVIQRDFAARRIGPDHAVAILAPQLDDAFHNLLRWFLPPILLRNDAFLVHGAAVIRDGEGFAFFGQSEAGKSTTIRLITEADPAAVPLGDDGILIQMRDGVPTVLAAPLGCGYSRLAPPALSAPLQGLFSLCQASEHELAPLSVSEGVSSLLASVMCVRFGEAIDARIDLALRFACSGPGISRMRFRKDPGFWPLLLKSDPVSQNPEEMRNVQEARPLF